MCMLLKIHMEDRVLENSMLISLSIILAILWPPRLSSVSVFLVDEPTAVSRLMEWSVRLLQWERSSFVKWGMWRITNRRVESLMSRPASRKQCIVRNWLRLSQPGTERLCVKKRYNHFCQRGKGQNWHKVRRKARDKKWIKQKDLTVYHLIISSW